MTLDRLKAWYMSHEPNSLPKAILFYRDGVSESQFAISSTLEYTSIRRACQNAGNITKSPSYSPAITFVVANKRHNTKFFPAEEEDSYKNSRGQVNGNVKPGLIFDRGVTSPYWFDFYIQAHVALEGTAQSTHYYVLVDDTEKWTAELLQRTIHQHLAFSKAFVS